ncbi:MAG: hypothetical protein HRU23_19155 [Gammaproteobacteria bacterium]|nr:hypothetical protein [Gammaproteobacteria bacterium]
MLNNTAIDMSRINAELTPVQHLHNGDIFNPQSPSHHLLAFVRGNMAKAAEQRSDSANIDWQVACTFDWQVDWQFSYAQPAVERFISYIRLQCHDGFLLEYRLLVFAKGSLSDNGPAWIEAEDLFVWKRSSKVVSNG